MSPRPALTLIVATRNRPDSLLSLLSKLGYLRERGWELVVVDNGSLEAMDVLAAPAGPAWIHFVSEPRPGKSQALNSGIAAAQGELLVFTDDDIEPDPAWLDELLAAGQRHPDADTFGGRILSRSDSIPGWIRRSRNLHEILLTEHDLGDQEMNYPPNRFPQGPNMAVRRRALEAVACPWDTTMGPGTDLPVGDEKNFFCRLGQGGGRPRIYVPSAVVYHRIEGRELGLGVALKRCFLGGYSAGLLRSRFPGQLESGGPGQGILRLLSQTASLQELACVLLRAMGFYIGRLRPSADAAGR